MIVYKHFDWTNANRNEIISLVIHFKHITPMKIKRSDNKIILIEFLVWFETCQLNVDVESRLGRKLTSHEIILLGYKMMKKGYLSKTVIHPVSLRQVIFKSYFTFHLKKDTRIVDSIYNQFTESYSLLFRIFKNQPSRYSRYIKSFDVVWNSSLYDEAGYFYNPHDAIAILNLNSS